MTDEQTKDSAPPADAPKSAEPPCELCTPSAPPGVTPDEAYTNYFAMGYAAGLNGLVPALCQRHSSAVGEWVVRVTRLADPRADVRARITAQLVRATGLLPVELEAIRRQHRAEGLSARDSFAYFAKVAAARGTTLLLQEDLLEKLDGAIS